MWISQLRLAAFRNHADSRLDLADDLTVVFGPNGAGKTSILEAAHLLCTGRSFRRVDADSLLQADADAGLVTGAVEHAGRSDVVTIGLGAYPNRYVLNDVPRRRARDVVGIGCCVVFSPDDLELIKGAPGERRALLDDILVASAPRQTEVQSEWARVLRQRNSLLKSIQGRRGASPPALETWTDLAAEKGAALAHERVRLVERLSPRYRVAAESIGGAGAELRYLTAWASPDAYESYETMREQLAKALVEARDREIDRGVTLVGPHRDDLVIAVEGRDARNRASQGEQRTLALALRLAQLRVLEDIIHDEPILLLDDVLSELDPLRRASLFEQIRKSQTLVTMASEPGRRPVDVEALPPDVEIGSFVYVEGGEVRAEA